MSWKFQPNDPRSKSLDAVTTGTGKAIPFNDYEKVNWLIVGSAGVTAGAVVIESAHDPTYAGTWNPLTAAPVTVGNNTAVGAVADFPPGGWVRARVSTALTGGTVTVYINGLKEDV